MKVTSTFAFLLFIFGCVQKKHNEFDAVFWANEYCNCLNEHIPENDIYSARMICMSRLNLENRLYRIYSTQSIYAGYFRRLPKETLDSVLSFNNSFKR